MEASETKKKYRHLRKSSRALYIGGEAFYFSFIFLWKCSFWLICRPWYMCAYFGFYYRPILYLPCMHNTHIAHAGKKLWISCNRKNLKKCAKVCLLCPYLSCRIVLTYPKWIHETLKKMTTYWRYLVPRNLLMEKDSENAKMPISTGLFGKWFHTYPKSLGESDGEASNESSNCGVHRLHLYSDNQFSKLSQHNKKFVLYSKLPLRTISRLWGKFVHLPFPDWFRVAAFKLYIWLYSCDLQEAQQQDLSKYKTLGDFFRRKLKPQLRPIHGIFPLVSPSDGTILIQGVVEKGYLEQVKGITYSLSSFFGPLYSRLPLFPKSEAVSINHGKISYKTPDLFHRSQSDCTLDEYNNICKSYEEQLILNAGNKLYYSVVYLAPGDYHCFHSPADWTVTGRRHFTGKLFSVKPGVASWLQGLFCINERVLYTGRWKYGFFSFTPVGALNVGSINVFFDKKLKTNKKGANTMGMFEDASFMNKRGRGVRLAKGELMGDFNLGSTIVMVFEGPKDFKFDTRKGAKVKYGQGFGHKTKKVQSC